jgi:hypothetical protein
MNYLFHTSLFALTTLFILFGFLKDREWCINSWSTKSARTALNFRCAVRIFADQFTLGFGASWFFTFPIAFWFFANWFAFRFWCLAMCHAVGLFANSDTFWAVEHFTSFIWAFYFTFWFFTFNIADSILWFST